jgi:hypothetical protein
VPRSHATATSGPRQDHTTTVRGQRQRTRQLTRKDNAGRTTRAQNRFARSDIGVHDVRTAMADTSDGAQLCGAHSSADTVQPEVPSAVNASALLRAISATRTTSGGIATAAMWRPTTTHSCHGDVALGGSRNALLTSDVAADSDVRKRGSSSDGPAPASTAPPRATAGRRGATFHTTTLPSTAADTTSSLRTSLHKKQKHTSRQRDANAQQLTTQRHRRTFQPWRHRQLQCTKAHAATLLHRRVLVHTPAAADTRCWGTVVLARAATW